MYVVIGLLIGLIFCSLARALYFLLFKRQRPEATVKALTARIVLSLVLFIFLIVAFMSGWIRPHGLMIEG
jgi:branched-subunit amino acid transport protein AzlD